MRRTIGSLTLLLILGVASSPVGTQTPAQEPPSVPAPAFVTPPVFESERLTAADGYYYDRFGAAVAVAGTTVYVGAPGVRDASGNRAGAVYVIDHSGDDWVFRTRLLPDNGGAGSDFGVSVAIDGSTLVVGAPEAVIGTGYRPGAAFVFEKSDGRWVQVARLTPPDGESCHDFGASVAIAGDTILVGAPGANVAGNWNQGAAYIFSKFGAGWACEATLVADDGTEAEEFGRTVAVSGSVAVVGAPQSGPNHPGKVRSFVRDSDGWIQDGTLAPSVPGVYDQFGSALSLEGDTLLVGAPRYEPSGAVFQYTRVDGVWTDETCIMASGTGQYQYFGSNLARGGDVLVVSAPYSHAPGLAASGAAHVFRLIDGSWVEQLLLGSSSHDYGAFQSGMAIVGGQVVAGAPGVKVGAQYDQGELCWWGMAPLPQVVTPRVTPTAGGALVTITGRFLMPGATVTIGGVPALDPVAIDPQTLEITPPARPPGPADIVVTNPDGRSNRLAHGLAYGNTDLAIVALSAPQAIGNDVPALVATTTKNIAKHLTATSVTRFYLSSDTVLDSNDRVLASYKVPALAGGRAYRAWASVTVPRSVNPGEYCLFAAADVTDVVGELREGNNTRVARVKIGCDVTVSSLVAPAKARAGEGLRATITTTNLGPGPAAKSTTRLYLTCDGILHGDQPVLGERTVSPLGAGSAAVWRGGFTIPENVPGGACYLVGFADDRSELNETTRTNNMRAQAITILPAFTRPVKE